MNSTTILKRLIVEIDVNSYSSHFAATYPQQTTFWALLLADNHLPVYLHLAFPLENNGVVLHGCYCYCYCLRLIEFCKSADRITNWTTISPAKLAVNGLRKKYRSRRATKFYDKLNAWFCLVFPAFGNGIVPYQNLFTFQNNCSGCGPF